METITEYKTVGRTDSALLDTAVNEALEEGFQPWGSPYAAMGFICQAVVKTELRENLPDSN
jgi:hypothetical protein